MIAFGIAAGVLLLLLGAVYGVVRYLYRFAMVRRPEPCTDWWRAASDAIPPVEEQRGPENLRGYIRERKCWLNQEYARCGQEYSILSGDGLRLVAHYIPPAGEMRGVFLMVHGYRSCGFDDFCGAVQNMTRDGFGCMVIDQRAHGLSEGNTICFGVREREDVREWALFLEKEFPGMPVILDGISMGAATVMAAAALDLSENVRGIIADCGYTSMRGIFEKVIRQWFHLPPFPLVDLADRYCRLLNGFGFRDVSSAECLRRAKVPVLLAHGEADDFVPYSMAVEIYEAVRDFVDIEFISVRDAGHGLSYLVDYDVYHAALCRLYEKIDRRQEAE